jgi:hypothetical protein
MSSNFPPKKKNVDWGMVVGPKGKKSDKSLEIRRLRIKGRQEKPPTPRRRKKKGFEEFRGESKVDRLTFAIGGVFFVILIAVGWLLLNN